MWERILTVIGSVASLVSLGVSIYVALSLRKIKNTYIFRARAPKFVRALSGHASTLIGYGEDFANSKQKISVELTRIDVRTRAMQGRMRGESKRAVKQLRKLIQDYRGEPDNVERFYAVYNEMQRVIEEVKELREDLDLEL